MHSTYDNIYHNLLYGSELKTYPKGMQGTATYLMNFSYIGAIHCSTTGLLKELLYYTALILRYELFTITCTANIFASLRQKKTLRIKDGNEYQN